MFMIQKWIYLNCRRGFIPRSFGGHTMQSRRKAAPTIMTSAEIFILKSFVFEEVHNHHFAIFKSFIRVLLNRIELDALPGMQIV